MQRRMEYTYIQYMTINDQTVIENVRNTMSKIP